jgi:hypothetical protein
VKRKKVSGVPFWNTGWFGPGQQRPTSPLSLSTDRPKRNQPGTYQKPVSTGIVTCVGIYFRSDTVNRQSTRKTIITSGRICHGFQAGDDFLKEL